MLNQILRNTVGALALVGIAGAASAEIMDIESNDTLATASPILRVGPVFSDVGVGTLAIGGGDVDVYSIDLLAGDNLTVLTSPFNGAPTNSVDTVIGLIDPSGTVVESDDDNGLGLLSNFTTIINTPGTYYLAVSGFGDLGSPGDTFGTPGNFDGSHFTEGNYILTVSIVPIPEPTTGVFAALGGLALLGRRRRR